MIMSDLRENIEAGVEAMMEHMRDDYREWSGMCARHDEASHSKSEIRSKTDFRQKRGNLSNILIFH